jgi:hypothetical protein
VDAATVVYKNVAMATVPCVFPKPLRAAKKSADGDEEDGRDAEDDGAQSDS